MLAGVSARRAVAVAAVACAAGGCGSAAPEELPRAAEPERSPPLREPPAGRVIRVGRAPEGVVADPRTGIVAVALRTPDRLALVDGRRGRLLRTVAVPESARHLALVRPGGPVLVPAERAGVLAEVALPRGRLLAATPVGAYPHDAVPAAGRVFVGDENGDTVSVVRGGRRVGRVRVALQPGGLAAAERGTRVAVVAVRERVLELFDARTLRRVGRASAGVGPTHAVSDGGTLLFVVDTDGDGLLLFRTRPRLELVRRVALPGAPYGIAIDRVRRRLWVTLTARNRLVEVTANGRPRPLRELPTVRQPDTVAVDERTGRVFVTGRVAGTLQLVDP